MAVSYRPEAKGLFSYTEAHFRRPSTMRERIFMAAAHLALAHDFVYGQKGRPTLASVETFLRDMDSSVYLTAAPLYVHGDIDIAYTWIPASQREKYQAPKHALKVAVGVQDRSELLEQAEMQDNANLAALQYTGMPDLQLPPQLYSNLLNQQQSRPKGIWDS